MAAPIRYTGSVSAHNFGGKLATILQLKGYDRSVVDHMRCSQNVTVPSDYDTAALVAQS